ncbi:Gfo/Idh/MocA family oxidoreductase [Paenibacillus filicis]|uniref:Gfo/Idh/MocA family oxidoreductase n=1 Tax=Paenibacillus gyeongsangnamensis TaxID=3388067 RepID=A0ABT4QBB1_9BACL|nr:Gfo/Idh/MocA family oxidoreductase [Paenibacillus filicis]MCZ8514182.1 Gfo/Idh/MocA family oxidoreductase [Paenibacillus filicis]
MNEIRWGIIGCGNVTEVKSGPGFQKAENSRLVAVMRRDEVLAADYAARHGVPKWYSRADELIRDPEVDAVYIATPPAYHHPYTLACAAAGKPVYVEKPMALNAAECDEMEAVCTKAGVPLFVAFYRRALPRFLQVKMWLEEGAIGEVRTVVTRHYGKPTAQELAGEPSWRVKPELSGGGYFFDVGSHTLDLLDYLLGPIVRVSGDASNQAGLYAAEDIVTGSYVFESGVHGVGTWCFSSNFDYEQNEIIGSKGRIEFSTFTEAPVRLIRESGTEERHIEHPAHVQQPLIQSIVDELLGRGACPSRGDTAIRTSRVMDAMIRGY